jgi:CRP/FNR family transcriptional regulator, anaerobic regulatory protein
MIVRMAQRLATRLALTPAEIRFLESAADRTLNFRRGNLIQSEGEPSEQAFFLESGWAMTFSDFPDGSRQSRRLHFPGDILGLPNLAMKRHPTSLEAVTDVTVAPFGKAVLAELMAHYPRLATILFIFSQEERVTMGDRLCAVSHLSCKGRLAFLLLDILTRLRASDSQVGSTFELHLTRAEMADITGMSPVHASRVWCELISDGLVAHDGPFVTIVDERKLGELSYYVDRSANLDFDWLPNPTG